MMGELEPRPDPLAEFREKIEIAKQEILEKCSVEPRYDPWLNHFGNGVSGVGFFVEGTEGLTPEQKNEIIGKIKELQSRVRELLEMYPGIEDEPTEEEKQQLFAELDSIADI